MLLTSAGQLDLVADLLNDRGELLARSGADSRQFRIEGDYPAGRYILQVRVMYHAGEGSYELRFGSGNTCVLRER